MTFTIYSSTFGTSAFRNDLINPAHTTSLNSEGNFLVEKVEYFLPQLQFTGKWPCRQYSHHPLQLSLRSTIQEVAQGYSLFSL